MTKDEVLMMALEALEKCRTYHQQDWSSEETTKPEVKQAITAIKEALAQPEQEPVALPCCGYADASAIKWNPHNQVVQCHNCGQIYTTPPQRKPLTDQQIDEEFKLYASQFDTSSDKWLDMGADDYFKAGFKAAHGIKENT